MGLWRWTTSRTFMTFPLFTFLLLSLIVLLDTSQWDHHRRHSSFFTEAKKGSADRSSEDGESEACHSAEALSGCSECIKQSPECAWCADPRLNASYYRRCDSKSTFTSDVCSTQYLFSPSTEIKVAPQHNLPLGTKRADSVTPIQLEPQQVEIRMKPGDIVEIPFRYLHQAPPSGYEVHDFSIQTSEYRSTGLDINFSIDCDGERKSGRLCPGVQPDQKIKFYAKVSLNDCNNKNPIAVSVGIYGYNTVSAIFVTPVCGCECENPRHQERRSPRCSYQGNLVCGVCQCDKGKGGEACECDLQRYGVSDTEELVNMCREHRTAPVCSGKGRCTCGKCSCSADYIRGKYCECDSADCPLNTEGRLCSGHGECECGRCVCERGFSGNDCSCNDDPSPCTQFAVVCTGNGYCECGKCSCNVGWKGEWCSEPQELPSAEDVKKSREAATSSSSSSSEAADDDMSHDSKGGLLPVGTNNVNGAGVKSEQRNAVTANGNRAHLSLGGKTAGMWLGALFLAWLSYCLY